MRRPPIPLVVTALFFLLPCAVSAQEAPEAVFGKFHRALQEGNIDDMNKHATPGGISDIAKLPADKRKQVLDLMKSVTPKSYKIIGRKLDNDGTKVTFRMTGTGASLLGLKGGAQDGVIVMVKQGGAWKVDEYNWKDAAAGPAAAAPSQAPERKPGVVSEPCVIKPIMTNEELARCR